MAAQAFFRDNPQGTLSKESLLAYGYSLDENVNLTINGGDSPDFSLASHFSIPGSDYFTADCEGRIMISTARR